MTGLYFSLACAGLSCGMQIFFCGTQTLYLWPMDLAVVAYKPSCSMAGGRLVPQKRDRTCVPPPCKADS